MEWPEPNVPVNSDRAEDIQRYAQQVFWGLTAVGVLGVTALHLVSPFAVLVVAIATYLVIMASMGYSIHKIHRTQSEER